MSESLRAKAPWHLWLVGIIALLWNSMGAFDYLMTQTRNESYMSMFTPEQLEFFYNFPTWSVALWATAVWGGVLGSILLLLRKATAVWIFLASLICMVVNTIYIYMFSNGMEVMGDPFSLVFSATIFIIAVFLFVYAKNMHTRKVIV